MKRAKAINQDLSIRISLKVVSAIAALLVSALAVMFFTSHRFVREEAFQKMDKALERMNQQVDNILLTVEQSAGNIYFEIYSHLNQPDMMKLYCQKIVETNPNVLACAICFEPDFYPSEEKHFMAYAHRVNGDSVMVRKSMLYADRPYYEQEWFAKTMEEGRARWLGPLREADAENEPVITFCMPIYVERRCAGVVSVDVSISHLSSAILQDKFSQHSYAVLFSSDGSLIVHPDSKVLLHKSVFSVFEKNGDTNNTDVTKRMISGETGRELVEVDGVDTYVLYRTFTRSFIPGRTMEKTGWNIAFLCPHDDIFGNYHRLVYFELVLVVIGLLLLLLGIRTVTHRQLLPLEFLAASAQRIAELDYDELIPDSKQTDEVGRLQAYFKEMQSALSTHVGQMKELTTQLKEQGVTLAETYKHVKEADHIKTVFLYNMTNQMAFLVDSLKSSTDTLITQYKDLTMEETKVLVDNVEQKGRAIVDLLKELLEVAEKTREEEVS